MTVQERLAERRLPAIPLTAGGKPDRKKMLDLLSDHEFGRTPAFGGPLYSFTEAEDRSWHGGIGRMEWIRLSWETPAGMYSFPFQLQLPDGEGPFPAFVTLSFAQKEQHAYGHPGQFFPSEELLKRGYALANVWYEDVTSDSYVGDGLARAYAGGPAETRWGKIGMWAFACSRVLDYLLTRPEIDPSRVAVSGHSRLGKAALWAGAQDERFSCVISNQSGCAGAALERGKAGERIREITFPYRFAYWFCPAYAGYADRETELPFDQHFLLACAAPRPLLVMSAAEDMWSDPDSEFLGAAACSEAYAACGTEGFVRGEDIPAIGERLFDGNVGYLCRPGTHRYSREDWLAQLDFREKHGV